MISGLVFQPEARLDVEDAAFWYENQRPGLGDRFVAELGRLLQQIAENPRQFPALESPVRRGLLHRFPYAVYFTADRDTVAILAVLHQHRHPETWKSRT